MYILDVGLEILPEMSCFLIPFTAEAVGKTNGPQIIKFYLGKENQSCSELQCSPRFSVTLSSELP